MIEQNLQLLSKPRGGPDRAQTPWKDATLVRAQLELGSASPLASARARWAQRELFFSKVATIHSRMDYAVFLLLYICGFVSSILLLAQGSDWMRGVAVVWSLVLLALTVFTFSHRSLFSIEKVFGERDKTYTTDDMVNAIYTRQATDPRDMAFGMWAVLEKRAATKLEVPDYSQDIGNVYHSLAVYLIRMTSSLDPLLYAAAESYPNQPSWVPNWAACEEHGWGPNVGEITVTDDYGNGVAHSASRSDSLHIDIRTSESILAVHAYHVATISMHVKLNETSDQWVTGEDDLHLRNVRWIHWCAAQKIQREWWQLTPAYYWWDTPSLVRRTLWNLFIHASRKRSASEVHALLKSTLLASPPLRFIRETFIARCNLLARGKKAVFIAQYPGAPARQCHGCCSIKGEVGDQIIRVKGLAQLLLVRACPGEANAVKIIGPVVLWGALEQGRKISPSNDVVSESQYTEYYIH